MRKFWAKALPPVILALLLPAAASAAGPELSLSPAPVSFGKVTAGEESNSVAVEVQNTGEGALSVEGSALEGEDSAVFKISASDCGWIESGQHCTVWLTFAPGSNGEKSAVLAVRTKEGPEATVPLTGTAVAPQLSFDPASLEFGIQRANESRSQGLQVTNSGEAAVRIGSTGIEGEDSGNFWTSYNDCWSGRRLEAGESCSVQVYFNPWRLDDYEATLTAVAAGVTFGAGLHGTGGEAVLAPASNPVEFGTIAVGEGSVQTIPLANEGNIGGGYFIALIAGGDVGSFRLIDENCTGEPIAPGVGCVAHVRFEPVGTGLKVARLAFFGESNGPTMVTLRGEGGPAAALPGPATAATASSSAPQPSGAPGRVRRGKVRRHRLPCVGIKVCPRRQLLEARRVRGG